MAVAYSCDKCGGLFNCMTKQMDTPEDAAWNIVALDCRLTEVMQLLTHLAKALQGLRSCCQTIQYQLWLRDAQRLT